MIKPYRINQIRDESDGSKTVFFVVSRSITMGGGKTRTSQMSTAFNVPPGADIDTVLYEELKKSGWL